MPAELLRNLQTWLVCSTIGTALKPTPETVRDWIESLEAALAATPVSPQAPAPQAVVGEAMVNRFLAWKLPPDFAPDCGITFKRVHSEMAPWGPRIHEPIGTNLLTADQARAMLEHVVGSKVEPPSEQQIIRLANGIPGVGDCISGNAAIAFARGLAGLTPSPAPSAAPHQGADALREAAKDTDRLDYMIEAGGFIVWTVRDGSIRQCQVWTQDEDEVYHQPAGESRFFNTTREAIDAARAALAQHQAPQQGEQQ